MSLDANCWTLESVTFAAKAAGMSQETIDLLLSLGDDERESIGFLAFAVGNWTHSGSSAWTRN